ncbi:hypothetical protein [Christiangramia sp. OXR-203]|uniref:hypothetical protein n=1 Tax=Christiangramia sp. OXR-203 TaxID=3100176 RepID=UPI002AC9A76C|nr:hypothetical protein [Christiangramia sp. OXR-203]WPZ00020.1 hypothetical protein T8I65_07350 [Christiangramia sp. OXR-203]
MNIQIILLITLALLIALGFSFYLNLYKNTKSSGNYALFGLRSFSIFLILLLLVNPKITHTERFQVKEKLVILSDASESIKILQKDSVVQNFQNKILSSEKLNNKFEIINYNFGKELITSDNTSYFSEDLTNIQQSLKQAEELMNNNKGVLVLLSDGNQNTGRDFRYYKSSGTTEILPVIIGDTSSFEDVAIQRINVNRYAFLHNKFPVEIFLSYSGSNERTTKLQILNSGKVIFQKDIEFSEKNRSLIINAELEAKSIGLKTYTARLSKLPDEKNVRNNTENFSVEIVDESSKILILSPGPHPDLGALKTAIESNSQRKVEIQYIPDFNNNEISDIQLFVLYNVNRNFQKTLESISGLEAGKLFITGPETDWQFLNELQLGFSKNSIDQEQDVFALKNDNFTIYQPKHLAYEDLPPLQIAFGKTEVEANRYAVQLYQKIQGVETDSPLLAVSRSKPKIGLLTGENIWRWRAASFRKYQNFEQFNAFIGDLVQNLSAVKSNERLIAEHPQSFLENEFVEISATYYDENYSFDSGANLNLSISDSLGNPVLKSSLVVRNLQYVAEIGNLAPGNYTYKLQVENTNLIKNGSFNVLNYNAEEQQQTANLEAMQFLASNNNSTMFYEDQFKNFENYLLKNDRHRPILKSEQKTVPLIDWYYLLFLVVFALALEWFYRKYKGLI